MHTIRTLHNRLSSRLPHASTLRPKPGFLIPQQARFGGMMGMGELADVLAGKCDPNDQIKLWEMQDRVGILLTLDDRPGVLNEALTVLQKHNINMTSIASRPPKTTTQEKLVNFNIDFFGSFEDENVQAAMQKLEGMSKGITKVGCKAVPWFPLDINDFDHIGKRVLKEGDGI